MTTNQGQTIKNFSKELEPWGNNYLKISKNVTMQHMSILETKPTYPQNTKDVSSLPKWTLQKDNLQK